MMRDMAGAVYVKVTQRYIESIIYRFVKVGGPDIKGDCAVPKSNAEGVLFGVDKAAAAIMRAVDKERMRLIETDMP